MARKFLTNVDLAKNQIINVALHVLASNPGTPVTAQLYYNSSTNKMMFHNGTSFVDPTDRAQHTGTQLAATISDFNTAVRTNRLDQMAAPIAGVSMNSNKITSLTDGTAAQDAATYGQLLAVANGMDWKASVRAASTANVVVASALTNGLVMDGVTLATGDRVLLKNQTTTSENGIYVVVVSGAASRSADADVSAEVTANMAMMVEEGTVAADTQWILTTNQPITLGTTGLVFAQIGSGTSYTQGTGITISGSVISIDTAVVARKFSAAVGDGTSTSLAVTHNFGTRDVLVNVYDATGFDSVECDVVRTNTNTVTLTFAVAPASAAYRAVVTG